MSKQTQIPNLINIIIVNWNAGHQLHDCIISISQYHHNIVEQVIIVDNASTDNSLSLVESLANLPFDLKIIRNNKNQGFGAACNQGAEIATTKYLLFLNPDTLLHENSLLKPYQFMENPDNHKVGIVGIQLIDENREIARSCANFPNTMQFLFKNLYLNRLFKKTNHAMTYWDHAENKKVDQVIGAFFFTTNNLFTQLGGFDERFFVYFEEVDFSLRAKNRGFHSYYLADAQAFHAGGGTSRNVKATRLFYSLRSRLLYGFKHFSTINAIFLALITLLIEPITRLVLSVAKMSFQDIKNTWQGYFMLLADIPNIIRIAAKK